MASRIISAQVSAANASSGNNGNNNSSDSMLPSLLSSPTRLPISAPATITPASRRVLVLPRGRRGTIADAFASMREAENNNGNSNGNSNSDSTIDISDSDDVTTDSEVLHRYQRRPRPRRRRWPRASILPHDLARSHDSDDISISMSRANGLDLSAVSQVSVFYSGRISNTAPGSPSLKGSLHLCKTRRHESNDYISALSVVYTDMEPVSVDIPNWWLIGTWPIRNGNVSATTVFQLLMDVLHESGAIPSVVISDLLLCDELHTVPGVQQAISMLKRGGSPGRRLTTQRLRLRERYSSEALESAAVLTQLNPQAALEGMRGPAPRDDTSGDEDGWLESWSRLRTAPGRHVGDGDSNNAADGNESIEGAFLHPVTGDAVSICVE